MDKKNNNDKKYTIAVIGLGYVGLPLAVEFSKKFKVVGFDINYSRVKELKAGIDKTKEVSFEEIKSVKTIVFTNDIKDIINCNIFIITVPTPIDKFNRPDLSPLLAATSTVGKILKKNDIVVYESTVYPGCTEEECVPVLEKNSGLKFNKDFFCGYSPERINPGDHEHRVSTIKKVVSGSTSSTTREIANVYGDVITAGIHIASSIKVAEAAKVIENSQRDINIAFVNELAMLFDLMGIDTNEVLQAAGTKWNFLNFKPGLVGGHCIGVDPYYLTHKAVSIGYHPEIILAGRRINDGMGHFVASKIVKLMITKNLKINNAKVLVLGITFKENCPDIRNTKVVDIVNELEEFGCKVDICDPWADIKEVKREYNKQIFNDTKSLQFNKYSAVVLAVAHDVFKELNLNNLKNNSVVYDVKGFLESKYINGRL